MKTKLEGEKKWDFIHKQVKRLSKLDAIEQKEEIAKLSAEYSSEIIHLIEDDLRDIRKREIEINRDAAFINSSSRNIYKKPKGYELWTRERQKRFDNLQSKFKKEHKKRRIAEELSQKQKDRITEFKIRKAKFNVSNLYKKAFNLLPKRMKNISHKDNLNCVEDAREILYTADFYKTHSHDTRLLHPTKKQLKILKGLREELKGKYWYLFDKKSKEKDVSPKFRDYSKGDPPGCKYYDKKEIPEDIWIKLSKKGWKISNRIRNSLRGTFVTGIGKPDGRESLDHLRNKREIAKRLSGSEVEKIMPKTKIEIDVYFKTEEGKNGIEIMESKENIKVVSSKIKKLKEELDSFVLVTNKKLINYFKQFEDEKFAVMTYNQLFKEMKLQ